MLKDLKNNFLLKSRNPLSLKQDLLKKNKFNVLATGITTAYEVADNQLREFVLTNKIHKLLELDSVKNEILLINDTLDPFTQKYFEKLLKFDKNLACFEKYIGWPICKIPSPYGTHESLASYFKDLLIKKLNEQNFFPKIIDTDYSYHTDYYQEKIVSLLKKEEIIKQDLYQTFGLKLETLYRPICPKCGRIDQTILNYITKDFSCKSCNSKFNFDLVPEGKFIWKIDCPMRWNHNIVDFEAFTENYLDGAKGTYYISSYISKNYLEGIIPLTCRFAYYRHSSRLNNLFLSLPYDLIEDIYLENFVNPNLISDDKIIKKTKDYMFGKNSFYKNSYLIYLFMPSFTLDNSTLNHINNVFFGITFRSNKDNYAIIRKNTELAYNFAKKFIKPKIQIKSLESISLEEFSKDELLEFINILNSLPYNPLMIKYFYKMLFGCTIGPSTKTLLEVLPHSFKKELISIIREKINGN